jgi:hypothetical protein
MPLVFRTPFNAEYLRERVSYDPETGEFRWKPLPPTTVAARSRNARCGSGRADRQDRDRYRVIKIDHQTYAAHRLAWLYMTGEWPALEIDHANLNKSDNRWQNLRLATRSQNQANRAVRAVNKTGFKGVHQKGRKYVAQLTFQQRVIYLGQHDTPEAAFAAYSEASERYHGAFARHDTRAA